MAELRQNTWTTDAWYDQYVAGTQGDYVGTVEMWNVGQDDNGDIGANSRSFPGPSSPIQIPAGSGAWKTGGAGQGAIVAIKTDGTLWTWGKPNKGENGMNLPSNSSRYSSPTQVGANTDWSSVTKAAGNGQVLLVKTDGTLWGMGSNYEAGTLGDGTIVDRSSPIQIGTDTTWSNKASKTAVFGRGTGARCVKTDGTMWVWGDNNYGNFGTNQNPSDLAKASSPVQMGTSTDWAHACRVYQQGLAIKTDGTLWAWGDNEWGSIGNNSKTKYSSPVQIPGTWLYATEAQEWAVLGIRTNGTLWAWGKNEDGKYGTNNTYPTPGQYTNFSSPVQVGSDDTWNWINGGATSLRATKTDGSLWAWGYQGKGGFGVNTDAIRYSSPTQIGTRTVWDNSQTNSGHAWDYSMFFTNI